MALLSGTLGYVKVNGVPKAFGKWRAPLKANRPKVNNFLSGSQRVVSGLLGASIQIEGPWDVGALGMAVGGSYTFLLGVSPSVFVSVTAIVDLEPSNDVEDAPRITITGDSDGPFTFVLP
jgi:hypothetical protein